MILILAAALATGWFWSDTLRARESMLRRCHRACDQLNVQLLDETVAVRRIGIGRTSRGRIALRRTYEFEFSADGEDRWPGRAILLGQVLETLQMEAPHGVTIMNDPSLSPIRVNPPSERHH